MSIVNRQGAIGVTNVPSPSDHADEAQYMAAADMTIIRWRERQECSSCKGGKRNWEERNVAVKTEGARDDEHGDERQTRL